jgi:hypothetical protein
MTQEQPVALPSFCEGASYGTVTITEKSGSEYVFPDVDILALRRVLPENGRVPENAPCLMLVNISMAVLSIPFRNVTKVVVGEEELWHVY